MDVPVPFSADREVQAASIVGPLHAIDGTIEVSRNQAGIRTIHVHDVHAGIPIRVGVEVGTAIRDQVTRRRRDRTGVLAIPGRQLTDRAIRDVHRVDLGLTPRELGVFGTQ